MQIYKHYIRIDDQSYITHGFSTAFEQPQDSDICINPKGGYQFRLTSDSPENPSLHNFANVPLYRWHGRKVVKRSATEMEADSRGIEALRAAKLQEINAATDQAIWAGVDAETSKGMEHFALQETDQINISNTMLQIQGGQPAALYHADGKLCRWFAPDEIMAIINAATIHKTYHTTYCNHLRTYIKRITDYDELLAVTYGMPLPQDLADHMAAILGGAE